MTIQETQVFKWFNVFYLYYESSIMIVYFEFTTFQA